jgi:hypothetical protein
MAAARLLGATGGEDAGLAKGIHCLEMLPEELQALVAHKALRNDPATCRYFQVLTYLDLCGFVCCKFKRRKYCLPETRGSRDLSAHLAIAGHQRQSICHRERQR